MGRQLHMEMDDEVFENTHPGCIWGVFNVLNYNYWHKNVKKMLPYSTKHNQTKCSKGSARPRKRVIAYDSDEVESLLDEETSRTPVKSSTRTTSSTNKKSLRTRIKSLISEEPPKKKHHRRKPRFQRTYSIHHLECSDYVTRISTNTDNGTKQFKYQGYYERFNKSSKGQVLDKYETQEEPSVDVLDIYGVNKDMFANVMKYTDRGIAQSFSNLPRSGSYPSLKLSQIRNFKSTKLDHKQNETWCHTRVDKSVADFKPQVVDGTTKYSRRTLSLNELSLEKYAQLVPKSSIEEPKLRSSKSLRLTNECSITRGRSLSVTGSYGDFQIELSSDHDVNVENDKCLDEDLKRNDSNGKIKDTTNLVESTSDNEPAEVPKVKIKEEIVVLKNTETKEEFEFAQISDNKLQSSSSFRVVERNSEEDVICPTDILDSEDSACENNSTDKESSADSQHEYFSQSLTRSSTTSITEFHSIGDETVLHKRSYDDFDYVSDILVRSGFLGNNLFALWYSLDQPLNPSIFHEVEACWPHEEVFLKDEFCCHHQLLFDLINEVLVQIYDTSFTYYPRPVSSNCHVPPMSAKFNILDEVWSKVSKVMNSSLELNQTVDGIVAQDMWTDDHWMNLQLDSECVAIELEDMFFDEILEEIITSL